MTWLVAALGLLTTPWYLLVAAYAPCLGVQDRARVYQWIAPVVCVAAARALPPEWLMPLLVGHWFNPWRRVI